MRIIAGIEKTVSVPDGRSDVIIFDDALSGFFLRVTRAGRASYGVDYRALGRRHRMSLGPVGSAKALTDARREAEKVLAGAKLGRDAVDERERLTAIRKAETVGHIASRFLSAQEGEIGKRTLVEWNRYLLRYLKPLHSRILAELGRRDIAIELDRIAEARSAIVSDRARTALVAMFSWAIRAGYVDVNPVVGTGRRAKPRSRDRVLDDAELAEVWHAAGDGDYGDILRLLVLTGMRREEIAALTWDEVDLDRAALALPDERVKNRREFNLPLSPLAVGILSARDRQEGRGLVFGRGEGGYSGWSRSKNRLDGRIARQRKDDGRKEIVPWRLHDLRRSAATGMARIGIALPVVERILNHISGPSFGGVAGIYQRHDFWPEMRAAMEAWCEHIERLISHR